MAKTTLNRRIEKTEEKIAHAEERMEHYIQVTMKAALRISRWQRRVRELRRRVNKLNQERGVEAVRVRPRRNINLGGE